MKCIKNCFKERKKRANERTEPNQTKPYEVELNLNFLSLSSIFISESI